MDIYSYSEVKIREGATWLDGNEDAALNRKLPASS